MSGDIETPKLSRGNREMATGGDGTLFNIVLYPNSSLDRGGFLLLMALISSICFVMGMMFMVIGAWPITAFFGVDLLLIYIAFKLNYRSARQYETLQLVEDTCVVRRMHPSGRLSEWRFEPYWLRVAVETPLRSESRLFLSSHGQLLAIGNFLPLEERIELAEALGGALDAWRAKLCK